MPQKKKILIFIDWFLPAYKAGGPIRSIANLVEYLWDEYDFYIYTSDKDLDGKFINVRSDEWLDFDTSKGAVKVYYSSTHSYKAVRKAIQEVMPDVVYLNSIYSVVFTLFPLLANRMTKLLKNSRVVIAPRGMFQRGALQLKAGKKRIFLNIIKPILFKSANIIWQATDEQERNDIREELGRNCPLELVGNIPSIQREMEVRSIVANEIRFVTISLVAKKKNHIFFLKLLRELQLDKDKKVIYDIYGPIKDQDYWERCVDLIKQMPENVSVNYKGSVDPTKVTRTLSDYHYFVLPTLGENFGHAIYEALATGVAVLISDQTPWQNLQRKEAGWCIPLLNEQEWKEQVMKIIQGEVNVKKFREGAIRLAHNYISEQQFSEGYGRLFAGRI